MVEEFLSLSEIGTQLAGGQVWPHGHQSFNLYRWQLSNHFNHLFGSLRPDAAFLLFPTDIDFDKNRHVFIQSASFAANERGQFKAIHSLNEIKQLNCCPNIV